MSLRTRLLLAVGAVALLALLAADVATYSSLRSFLLGRIDQELQAAHQPVEESITGRGPQGGPGGPGGPGTTNATGEGGGCSTTGTSDTNLTRLGNVAPGMFLQVQTADEILNCPYYRPGEFGETAQQPRLPAKITGFSTTSNPGGEPTKYFNAKSLAAGGPSFRVRASQLSNGDILVLALPLSDATSTLDRLLLIELAVTGGALVLAGVAGWWLVRIGLRPLAAIERTAVNVAAGDLAHRVPGESDRTEVGRLAGALNVMLGRIESAFAVRDATETKLRLSEGRMRRFVADASHELRTPLTAVSAYAELFERGADRRPEDLGRVMSGIRIETSRMSHLVDDLLLLARMDEGRPLEKKPLELVGLAAEAVEAATTVGPEWPVRLEAHEPVEVLGDRARLRQVLDNLLANVRAHTPPGTTATVRVWRDGDIAVCEVQDDGPGIPPEQAARLFERFYRSDASRSRASGGTGLGLSIVAAITEAHGGTASARPADGGGSVFTVRVPVSEVASATPGPAAGSD
jgi:two-component system, OmpR family, sensor kinase